LAPYYLTTAIDYANGEPHVGHAFEKIGADVIARYHRLCGDEVRFVIGMDEHGQNVAREAAARQMTPQALVDQLAVRWQEVWRSLQISNDDFIRTTQPRHVNTVRVLLERIADAGDLYLDRYSGPYCERCEAFRKENELIDGRCPFHPTREIVWTEEENFFFKLSSFRDRLLEHISSHPAFIRPASRRNEIVRLLEGGLEDVSASRARVPWGVAFPGAEEHTVYVWFDALPNYLSAIGFPDGDYGRWWPANLHVIGKDITRFHCVIWPAMLLSAGVELPESVWAHGFVMVGGGKLSKSEAMRLDLGGLIERHGPDAFRYFLMREAPWDGDRDFPSAQAFLDQFDARYTADLANDVGNLLNRSVAMVERYREGRIVKGGDAGLEAIRESTLAEYHARMSELRLSQGIEAVLSLVRTANAFVDKTRPWQLAKHPEETERLDAVLGALVRALASVAVALAPFMPVKAAEMWHRLGGEGEIPPFSELDARMPRRLPAAAERVLFPRE